VSLVAFTEGFTGVDLERANITYFTVTHLNVS
jgi:hypothetical protein